MSPSYQKACALFYDFKRYDLAERELRGVLVVQPDDALAHALLGLCLIVRRSFREAEDEVKEALRLAPQTSYAHFVRARLFGARGELYAAKAAIEEAIRLSPMQPDYFSWLAAYLYDSGERQKALKAAEKGLEIDAQHVGCLNLRALALAKLGKTEEARKASLSSLERDPVNAISLAIEGTTLMRQAEYRQARATFLEALRLDPLCEWAQRGYRYSWRGVALFWPVETIGGLVGRLLGRASSRLRQLSSRAKAWVGSLLLVVLMAGLQGVAAGEYRIVPIELGVGLAVALLFPLVRVLPDPERSFYRQAFPGSALFLVGLQTFLNILPLNNDLCPHAPPMVVRVPLLVLAALLGICLMLLLVGLSSADTYADLSLPRRGRS